MNICPKCGNQSDAKFCSKCGTEMQHIQEAAHMSDTVIQNSEPKVEAEKPQNTETVSVVPNPNVNMHKKMSPNFNKEKANQYWEKVKLFFKRGITKMKELFHQKWMKRILIIVGIFIVLLIALAIVLYAMRPDIGKDFDQKTEHEIHGLSYYTPKSWKESDRFIWSDENSENSDVYVKKNKDGEKLVYMEITYEGEETDVSKDDIIKKYAAKSNEGRKKGSFQTKDNWQIQTLEESISKRNGELYVAVVSCDDSIFSFKFLYSPNVKGTSIFEEIINSVKLTKYDNPKVLQSLTATYSGPTTAGTEIDTGNTDITVTAEYDIGGSEVLNNSRWIVQNPGFLQADQTSSFTIEADGVTCTLNIECSTVSESGYKAKCQTYSYDDLSRNPDKYEGNYIKVSGRVVQEQGGTVYRIATKGNYDNIVYVTFAGDSSSRILEDDNVTVYGTYYGVYTYTTVMGAAVTIPRISAKYID